MNKIKSTIVKNWVDCNLPPLSWSVISLACLKSFFEEGLSPRSISEDIYYSEKLFTEISIEINKRYNNYAFKIELQSSIKLISSN